MYEETDEKFNQHFKSITFELEPYLSKFNAKFIQGKAKDIKDNKGNRKQIYIYIYIYAQWLISSLVHIDGKPAIDYDYLVICTGSSYADPWKTHDNDDIPTRQKFLLEQRNKYKGAENILCIGGGPVGTELVTEIAYRSPKKNLTLVDMGDTVLASAPNGLGDHATRIINALPSIKTIFKEKAEEKEDSVYETDKSHTRIKADLVYNCIGVTPNSDFLKESHSDWLNDKKQVVVDEELKVKNTTNIFAIGDVNSVEEAKMFYTAHMQAVHFVKSFKRILKNQGLIPYKKSKPNMVISMGPSYAVGLVSGVTLTGWPFGLKKGSQVASLTKFMIERITMNDFNLKTTVNDALYCISRP